ncbi:MAG: hypothetical protein WBD53_15025 [Xanthobacteraceae bacterium]
MEGGHDPRADAWRGGRLARKASEPATDANIAPRSLNCIIDALHFANKLIDSPDQAVVDVALRGLLLGLAEKIFDR